jgi:hypothetical protein
VRRGVLLLAAIAGLLLGVAAGLYLSWELWPMPLQDSEPAQLRRSYVSDYLVLIAIRYAKDGNLQRARADVQALGLPNGEEAVAELTKNMMARESELSTVRALARLSYDLGVGTSAMAVYVQKPTATVTPSATATPAPTDTPPATATATPTATPTPLSVPTATPAVTPSPTPAPEYRLAQKLRTCLEEAGAGRLEVYVRDSNGRGVAGVPLHITWADGEETFYTGLKLERDTGYADYALWQPGEEYALTLPGVQGPAREILSDPYAAGCPVGSRAVVWQLTFVQSR